MTTKTYIIRDKFPIHELLLKTNIKKQTVFVDENSLNSLSKNSSLAYILLKKELEKESLFMRKFDWKRKKYKSSDIFIFYNNYLKFGNLTCEYCLKDLAMEDVSFDHYIPASKGGSNHFSNINISCEKCNNLKKNIHPLIFPNIMKKFIVFVRQDSYKKTKYQLANEKFFRYLFFGKEIPKQELVNFLNIDKNYSIRSKVKGLKILLNQKDSVYYKKELGTLYKRIIPYARVRKLELTKLVERKMQVFLKT